MKNENENKNRTKIKKEIKNDKKNGKKRKTKRKNYTNQEKRKRGEKNRNNIFFLLFCSRKIVINKSRKHYKVVS